MAARKKPDKAVQQVLELLQADYGARHPQARIEGYRYNPYSIRIRIIDPDFKSTRRLKRGRLFDPILEKLPEDTLADITLMLLLTPDEAKTSLGSLEFDNPTPSRL